jgi:hypothetical protein
VVEGMFGLERRKRVSMESRAEERISKRRTRGKGRYNALHVGVEVCRASRPGDGEPDDDRQKRQHVRCRCRRFTREGRRRSKVPSSKTSKEDEGEDDGQPRPALDVVKHFVAAEGDAHRDDSDDDDTGGGGKSAGVDSGEDLTGNHCVDSAKALCRRSEGEREEGKVEERKVKTDNEGDEVEESREDGDVVAEAVERI